jgi:hypothetical protein
MSNILLDLMGVLGSGSAAGGAIFVDGGPTVGSPDTYADSTPGGSQIQVNFLSNGTATVTGATFATVNLTNWATPTSLAPGTYQIRTSLMSGSALTINSGTSWLALTSNRSWGYFTTSGILSGVIRVEIRDGTGPVLSTGYFQLTANAI